MAAKTYRPQPKMAPLEDRDGLASIRHTLRGEELPEGIQARLFAAAERGHTGARDRLVLSWADWIYMFAAHHFGLAPSEDLVLAAYQGMYEALDTWDPTKGRSLGQWAVTPMKKHVNREIARNRSGYTPPVSRLEDDTMPVTVNLMVKRQGTTAISPAELENREHPDVLEAAPVPTPEDVLAAADRNDVGAAALGSLPSDQKNVLALLTGFDPAGPMKELAISRYLGIPVKVVRETIADAAETLLNGPHAEALHALWSEL